MNLLELAMIAVGLSMDAFAVSICKGLAMGRSNGRKALIVGLYFGVFQAIMPLIGYLLGAQFAGFIRMVDHWIAFALLIGIGGKMIYESFSHRADDGGTDAASVRYKQMLPLAVATSIDALAVGISFALLQVNIVSAVSFIGLVTFALSIAGVFLGTFVGEKFQKRAEFFGGAILSLIGLKVLLEHLGIILF